MAIGVVLTTTPITASLNVCWDSFPWISIPVLLTMKWRVLRREESQPNHQSTNIIEFISLKGKRNEFEGDIPVCSREWKMMNSASKVGYATKNRMYRVEFHPISLFYSPLAENSLTGSLATV